MKKQIYFISENVNKYKELDNFLKQTEYIDNINLIMIKPDYELNEIQSMDRNAIVSHKLIDACKESNRQLLNESNIENTECWLLVEDTSFCIANIGNLPGPFIKYFLESMTLDQIASGNLLSSATSYVNFAIGKLHIEPSTCYKIAPIVFEGKVNGHIVEPRGQNGFGYDSIFKPIGSMKTNAEMTMNEKEEYNPRTRAFIELLKYIK